MSYVTNMDFDTSSIILIAYGVVVLVGLSWYGLKLERQDEAERARRDR